MTAAARVGSRPAGAQTELADRCGRDEPAAPQRFSRHRARGRKCFCPLPMPGAGAVLQPLPRPPVGHPPPGAGELPARPAARGRACGRPAPRVSVIVPARNEAGNIPAVFARTPEMGSGTELIFVEGHSSDDTYGAIERAIADHPQRRRDCSVRPAGARAMPCGWASAPRPATS